MLMPWRSSLYVLVVFLSGCAGNLKFSFAADPNAIPTVFIGDSITQFWDLKTFFPRAPYSNRGIVAQTTDEILARFDQDVVARHPQMVVILAGTNDVVTRVPLSDSISNIQQMISKAQAANIRVVIGTLPPVASDISAIRMQYAGHDFNADILSFNSAVARIGVPIADYHLSLTGSNGLPLPGVLVDGLHPSERGYFRMEKILSTILP
jgi:lysophospholipase L1-like esterase